MFFFLSSSSFQSKRFNQSAQQRIYALAVSNYESSHFKSIGFLLETFAVDRETPKTISKSLKW